MIFLLTPICPFGAARRPPDTRASCLPFVADLSLDCVRGACPHWPAMRSIPVLSTLLAVVALLLPKIFPKPIGLDAFRKKYGPVAVVAGASPSNAVRALKRPAAKAA